MLERLSPRTRIALRVAAGVAIGIAAGFLTLILFFVGGVTATGCFFECGEPDVVAGSLLLAGAVLSSALTISAIVWGVIGWNRQVLVKVAATVAGSATLLVLVVAIGG